MSQFIDRNAQVQWDEDEEEEEEEEEEEDWDEDEDEDEDEEEDEGDSSERVSREVDAADLDAIATAVRRRAVASGYVGPSSSHAVAASPSSSTRRAPNTDDSLPSRILKAANNAPTMHDPILFSVNVKAGKEVELVYGLMRRSLEMGSEGVMCAFFVPKAPRRIYVEAPSPEIVRRYLKGFAFVVPQSMFIVPMVERVALLRHPKHIPAISASDFVKVRNGLYRGDMGQVLAVSSTGSKVYVKIKSREKLDFNRNIARGLKMPTGRPAPYLLSQERTNVVDDRQNNVGPPPKKKQKVAIMAEEQHVDIFKNDIMHNGLQYTEDGYRVLKIRMDRLQRVNKPSIEEQGTIDESETTRFSQVKEWSAKTYSRFKIIPRADMATLPARLSNPTSTLSDKARLFGKEMAAQFADAPPMFIHVRNRVRITAGPMKGRIGTAVDVISGTTAVVDILPSLDNPTLPELLTIELTSLKRVFELGELIKVMVGPLKGKGGIIAGIETSSGRDMFHVIDPVTSELFEVPETYVDTGDGAIAPPKRVQEKRLTFGSKVRVTAGRNAGRQGTVSFVGREYVRLIEDNSYMEIAVPRSCILITHEVEVPTLLPQNPPTGEEIVRERKANPTRMEPRDPHNDPRLRCRIRHFDKGFEGETVYVWKGPFKGKLGRIFRTSGSLARLTMESAIFGSGVRDIPTEAIIAECGCIIAAGLMLSDNEGDEDGEEEKEDKGKKKKKRAVKPVLPWDESELANIPHLFNRSVHSSSVPKSPRQPRSFNDFDVGEGSFSAPRNVDMTGMWIFHEKVANLRKFYDLIVRIESHSDRDVSGRRDGRILAEPDPKQLPIPTSMDLTVPVRFSDGTNVERVENMLVGNLRPTKKLRDKGTHVIVEGPQIGTLVHHVRTQRGMARVFEEGAHRLEQFNIEKEKLCIVEKHL